jgi:hypothetical protein
MRARKQKGKCSQFMMVIFSLGSPRVLHVLFIVKTVLDMQFPTPLASFGEQQFKGHFGPIFQILPKRVAWTGEEQEQSFDELVSS